MIIKIDFESEMPIYEQLRRQIIEGIARGQLRRVNNYLRLGNWRRILESIFILLNKTYNILKNEGFLTIDRRRGAMVNNTNT